MENTNFESSYIVFNVPIKLVIKTTLFAILAIYNDLNNKIVRK